ncbi:MAG: hypothetical protein QXW10_01805 [Candidatus Micrarchaeaceae archaeon]
MIGRSKKVRYSLKSAEKHLKALTYASVFLDGFVAIATVLSFHNPDGIYVKFLYVSDYLLFAEVVAAALLAIFIVYLRYAKKASKNLSLAYFRYKVSARKKRVRQAGLA